MLFAASGRTRGIFSLSFLPLFSWLSTHYRTCPSFYFLRTFDSHRRARPGTGAPFFTSLSPSYLLFRCLVNTSHDFLFCRCTAQPDPFTYAVIRRLHLTVHALCAFRAAWGCQLLIKNVHTQLKVSRLTQTHPELNFVICPAGFRPPCL
jgi:hypothetical protein